jgi:hypothetical protein
MLKSEVTELDFVAAIRAAAGLRFHTALARSVVRIVEAPDQSLLQGGERLVPTTGISGSS